MEVYDTVYKPNKSEKKFNKILNDDEIKKKIESASGGGNLYPIFYKFHH